MSTLSAPASRATDLDGRALLLPAVQSEPLPIRRIDPAPCTQACPAGINVKAYVSLIAERRFAEALEVIRRRCPLPGVCGRICHHPCESACDRGAVDEPVAIRSLKRVAADLERELEEPRPPAGPPRPQRVAVVGAGPAGLTAAYDLRLAGFPVTVFEGQPEPGGMLRYGITAYRLPRDVLDAEIAVLARAGVDIRTGQRLGMEIELDGLWGRGYSAVLLAVGTQLGRPLPADGDRTPDVEDALEFLRRVNAGDRTMPGRRVLVVGGGSTAVEAARAALRLGARSVEVLYRRYREELLAGADEVEIAEAEGIVFTFLVTPTRVIAPNGRLQGLECQRVGLGEQDGSGRRRPIPIPGSEFLLEADRVLAAVGQEPDLTFLRAPREDGLVRFGRLCDAGAAMTVREGLFAAGDVVSGPSTVIEAIAAGHRAAESIRHFIEEGRPGVREERPEWLAAAEYGLPDAPPAKAMRVRPSFALPRPGREFVEVEQAFTEDEAVSEARRCLRCGPCGECRICAPSCSRRHVMVRDRAADGPGRAGGVIVRTPATVALALDSDRPTPGWLLSAVRPEALPEIDTRLAEPVAVRPVRARIRSERCRGCARCLEVCPFHALSLPPGAEPVVRIEAALCRGCNLCTSVCPTKAALPSALSPEWWGSRLEEACPHAGPPASYVVLACQRRAGALERALERDGAHVEVIRFRCVGQVDAAMLLELAREGARAVLVAGCLAERCRFRDGARLAQQEAERAHGVLALLGFQEGWLACDWSAGRAQDPLDAAVRRMVEARGGPPPGEEIAAWKGLRA